MTDKDPLDDDRDALDEDLDALDADLDDATSLDHDDSDGDSEDGLIPAFDIPEFDLPFGSDSNDDGEAEDEDAGPGLLEHAHDAGETLAEYARTAWAASKPILQTAYTTGREGWQSYREDYSLTAQVKLGVGVTVILLVAAAILFGWVPSAHTVFVASLMLGALAAGLTIIPGSVFLLSKSLPASMRGVLARILWTIATLTQGGLILRHEDTGEYQTYAPIFEDDGMYIETDDGQRVKVGTPTGHWFRLGKKKFGISYEKTPEMMGDLAADFDEEYIADASPESAQEAYADGGHHHVALLDMERGDYNAFTPYTDYLLGDGDGDGGEKTQGEDGWILRADKAVTRKRGAGGRRQAGKAKEQTLKEHGGNNADLGGKWFYLALMGAMVIGSLSGYLAGGM